MQLHYAVTSDVGTAAQQMTPFAVAGNQFGM